MLPAKLQNNHDQHGACQFDQDTKLLRELHNPFGTGRFRFALVSTVNACAARFLTIKHANVTVLSVFGNIRCNIRCTFRIQVTPNLLSKRTLCWRRLHTPANDKASDKSIWRASHQSKHACTEVHSESFLNRLVSE